VRHRPVSTLQGVYFEGYTAGMELDELLSNLAVEVDPFALCMVSSGWRLSLPGPPEVLLHFVLQGNGSVLGPKGETNPVGPYWLGIVPRGAVHALVTPGRTRSEERITAPPSGEGVPRLIAGPPDTPEMIVACGLVRVRYGGSLGLFDHLHEVLAVDLSGSPQVKASFQGILAEQTLPGPGSRAMKAALLNQCLIHLFRHLLSGSDCPFPWLTALRDERLGRAVDRILKEPAAHHTVDSLADAASMSRSVFAERFTQAFGRSPMNLLHQIRMQRAALLLRRGNGLSLDQVAQRVGFLSRSHFSQAFKKHFGVTPAAHRST
jgi:AraC-like DNA-binding protein